MLLFLLFLKLSRWKHSMTAPFGFFLCVASEFFCTFFHNFFTKFQILSFPFAEFVSVKRDKNNLIYATDSHQIQTQVWKCLPKTNTNHYLGISQPPNPKEMSCEQETGTAGAHGGFSFSWLIQLMRAGHNMSDWGHNSNHPGRPSRFRPSRFWLLQLCHWRLCHQNVHILFTAWIDCCMIFQKFPQNALFWVKARCFHNLSLTYHQRANRDNFGWPKRHFAFRLNAPKKRKKEILSLQKWHFDPRRKTLNDF